MAHGQRHAGQDALAPRRRPRDQRRPLRTQDIVVDHHHVEDRQAGDMVDHRRVEAVGAQRADQAPALQTLEHRQHFVGQLGRSRAVQGISAGDAHEFLCQLQADEAFSPVRTAAARAAVWDAFLRQDLDLLPATLPDALRASSSALLTDLTALDYDALERTLEFLANNSAAVAAQALPGQWNAASGTYTVTDASRAALQTFFNVSPTEAQASSFSEP